MIGNKPLNNNTKTDIKYDGSQSERSTISKRSIISRKSVRKSELGN